MTALSLLLVASVLLIVLGAYRLVFHPLASFPGPYLAATTDMYRAYYDIAHQGGGEMVHHLEELHSIYG